MGNFKSDLNRTFPKGKVGNQYQAFQWFGRALKFEVYKELANAIQRVSKVQKIVAKEAREKAEQRDRGMVHPDFGRKVTGYTPQNEPYYWSDAQQALVNELLRAHELFIGFYEDFESTTDDRIKTGINLLRNYLWGDYWDKNVPHIAYKFEFKQPEELPEDTPYRERGKPHTQTNFLNLF